MGAFDDLVPKQRQSGSFDDLVPKKTIGEPNWIEQQLAKITLPEAANWGLNRARGFAMGAADPSVGAAQLVANVAGMGDGINKAITNKENEYQAERKAVGADGLDIARFAGNVASPVNLAAAKVPFGTTTGTRIAQGAAMGAAGGAMEPVTDTSQGYAPQKAGQIVTGSIFGAAATPAIAALGDFGVRKLLTPAADVRGAQASMQADEIVRKALADVGQTITDLPPNAIKSLREQVVESLKQGKQIDPAAVLRMRDFQEVGIPALQGQISRDPMQFARELNLRGVANVGEPIGARLSEQNAKLQEAIGSLRSGASELFPAGEQLLASLKGIDKRMQSGVDSLYAKARDNLGRAAPMDSYEFSTKANFALDSEMLGGVLPDSVRSILNDVTAGKIPLTVNSAVQIDRTLSKIQRGAKPDEAYAIGKIRDALNSTSIADNVGEDAKRAFDEARKGAAKRFGMHDAIPALKAAANDSIAADDFVSRFILNGKTVEVQKMANVLRYADPEAFNQARAQLGAKLYRSAFGEDVVGTKGFAAERFNKAIGDIGSDKLAAFFSPAEVEQIKRLGRVGAYIHQQPAGAAVNTSNTASALMNIGSRIPGAPAIVGMAKNAKDAMSNHATVRAAVNPVVPVRPVGLTKEQTNVLASLLAGGSFGVGGLGGSFLR